MPDFEEIGEISLARDSIHIEWTIRNFFSYTAKNVPYNSPPFDLCGSQWWLRIHPNDVSKTEPINWIGLYLWRQDVVTPQTANFNLGVKIVDGLVEVLHNNVTAVFESECSGWGCRNFLKRSELLERKSELTSLGMLTVVCALRTKSIETSTRLDTLSGDLFEMFTSKKGCDVTLKVQDQEFLAHKLILSARSSVFATMFEVEMIEKNTGIVNIVDCDPVSFNEFLKFLYCGKAEKLSNNAFELYKIADKYDVEELKLDCLTYIMTNLTVENILDAVSLGDQFSLNSLKIKTTAFFNRYFNEIVLNNEKWESFLLSNGLLAHELLENVASKMQFRVTSLKRKHSRKYST